MKLQPVSMPYYKQEESYAQYVPYDHNRYLEAPVGAYQTEY